jgi:hypothetical protein
MKWIYPNGNGSYREVDYSNESDRNLELMGDVLGAVIALGIWAWQKLIKSHN